MMKIYESDKEKMVHRSRIACDTNNFGCASNLCWSTDCIKETGV